MIRFLLFIFLLSDGYAREIWKGELPEGFSAEIQISGNEFHIQDPLYVNLILKYPAGFTVNQNSLRSNLLRNLSSSPSPFALTQETTLIEEDHATLQYILDPQMSGDFTLTFYDIHFFSRDTQEDKKRIIFSPLFPIKILPVQKSPSLTEEPASLLTLSRNLPINLNHKNRKILAESTQNELQYNLTNQKNRSFPWGILGAIFVTSLVYAVYRFQKPKNLNQKRFVETRSKALQRLQQVKSERSDKIYIELSNLVRFYIEDRYGIHAPRKTTQEFLAMLPLAPLPDHFPKDELQKFLLLTDHVKFAKGHTTEAEQEQAWQAALKFIET